MIHIDLTILPESGNITHMWIIPTSTAMRLDEERSGEQKYEICIVFRGSES